MPLFLVRWPNLSGSLIRARNKGEVVDILDELGDPTSCEISRYDGPVFIDFELPIRRPTPIRPSARNQPRPLSDADVEIGEVSELVQSSTLRLSVPPADTGFEMNQAIFERAFPHLAVELFDVSGGKPRMEAVKAAARMEAMRFVQDSWRHANAKRAKDPVDKIAVMMGTSREVVERLRDRLHDDDAEL